MPKINKPQSVDSTKPQLNPTMQPNLGLSATVTTTASEAGQATLQPRLAVARPRVRKPIWDGPSSGTPQGGVTYSLLARYLICKERYRIHTIENLQPTPTFNPRIEYGNMWHLCEEKYAVWGKSSIGNNEVWLALADYAQLLCRRYPLQAEEIEKWRQVCMTQFTIYVNHYAPETNLEPLLTESKFCVPYYMPRYGKTLYLRGKWDVVGLRRKGTPALPAGLWVVDHKTKSEIDSQKLEQQLTFDLQTMLYLTALDTWQQMDGYGDPIRTPELADSPLSGVLYNVIRRPLSGGKGSIVQKKATKNHPAETKESYYARLGEYITTEPESYFARWWTPVTNHDLLQFREECLDPLLANLCDDYEWWAHVKQEEAKPIGAKSSALKSPTLTAYDGATRQRLYSKHCPRHYRMPYGLYNNLYDEGSTDLDNYLATGSTVGLQEVTDLFPELNDVWTCKEAGYNKHPSL